MKKGLHYFLFHWKKVAWGSTGVALSTLGTQLDGGCSKACFVLAAVCAILAANDHPKEKNK